MTAQARRITGLWPDAEATTDQLLAELERRIDQAESTEEKTKLRRLAEAVGGGSRDLLVEVLASIISRGITGG